MENIDKTYICDIMVLKDICWRDNMADEKNTIIAGKNKGLNMSNIHTKRILLHTGLFKSVDLTNEMIESFEEVDKSTIDNFNDFIKRGMIGGAIAGDIGKVLGALSAKKEVLYTIIINYKDGEKSLAIVNRPLYAAFENLFKKVSNIRLIKCPACGKEVSNQAESCPECGQPINILLEFQNS